MWTIIARYTALCGLALFMGTSTAALSQQQLNEAQAKVLECMLTNIMRGQAGTKDLSDCEQMLKNRNQRAKVKDLMVDRLYHQYGFEKTIDILGQFGGESQALQRSGSTFSFRDYSFRGYAYSLYATYPEISTADLVAVLRKLNAFPEAPEYAGRVVFFKSALGETLTDDDFLNLLVTDYPKESPGYFYKLTYGALNSEAYRENIADFVDSYLSNKSDPRYSALVKRDHVLVDFLNFLAVYADEESLAKVGDYLSKRLDSLAYYQKMEIILILYRLGRDEDIYFEADSSQCYLMLTQPDADAFDDIEDHCIEYLQDVSYYYAKINGREEKGQSRFASDRLNGGFHQYSHDLYLRHVVETQGIAPVLEASQGLAPLDRARVLTYAAIFLEDNMAWQDLGSVLELLKPLSGSLQDNDVAQEVRQLDIAYRRNR